MSPFRMPARVRPYVRHMEAVAAERDRAYRDRAELLSVLANIFPSHVHADSEPESDWPVLYLDTPAGQMSWHINPRDLELFDMETYQAREAAGHRVTWDGHTRAEKSERLRTLAQWFMPEELLTLQIPVDDEPTQLRAVRDAAGDIRLGGMLVAIAGTTRDQLQAWHDAASSDRYRGEYAAALELIDRENAHG
ncbi:hypothetical protein IU433_14170 [Nocardia puris]|uniref:WDGH domain-containing protein n=1 Tax=Nocardia puris TaxID=208602 RepID=UPI001895BF3B|nr:hypothetical protein [Nocardia puris]MBF6460183.1 hypothetical protein [Nocardia puris]